MALFEDAPPDDQPFEFTPEDEEPPGEPGDRMDPDFPMDPEITGMDSADDSYGTDGGGPEESDGGGSFRDGSEDDKDLTQQIEKFLNIGLKVVDKVISVATGRGSSGSSGKSKSAGRAYDDIPIPLPTGNPPRQALPSKQEEPASQKGGKAGFLDEVQRALEAQE